MYDIIVLGVGSMGTFTCLDLARRGLRVLGIDQFTPPHALGSHSGETRVFRQAYAEHPDYVPLARLAGHLWEEFGSQSGKKLLTRCGQINIGSPDSRLLMGMQESAALHGIHLETLDHDTLRARYPLIVPAANEIGILEPGAGWVDVNASLSFALEEIRRAGGKLLLNTPVVSWRSESGRVLVETAGERFAAKRLIVTAGAWASEQLGQVALPLTVKRKVLVWLEPRSECMKEAEAMPITTFAEKFFYTFPAMHGMFKVAVHWTEGQTVRDPRTIAPAGDKDIEEAVESIVKHLQPMFGDAAETRRRVVQAKTCLYTMTPDEHFVLDRIPEEPVWYAAGFSGHGFKFAPVVGKVLAEVALNEPTSVPVDFLCSKRAVLTGTTPSS